MIQKCKVSILYDNNSIIGDEFADGGFSALIETEDTEGITSRLLFDTGKFPHLLERNLKALNINIKNIDYIVLSHGHFDHTGGFSYLYKNGITNIPVVCHPYALNRKILYHNKSRERLVGFNVNNCQNELRNNYIVLDSKNSHNLTDGIWTTGEIERLEPLEELSGNLLNITHLNYEFLEVDELKDDIALVIELVDGRKIIISGCCHAGLINTMDHVIKKSDSNITAIIGGLYLNKASDDLLFKTTKRLKELPLTHLYPLHSSGSRGINYLKEHMSELVSVGGVGSVVEIKC